MSFLGICFLIVWLLILIDGLVPQLQMFFFEGLVPIPMIVIKGILVILCLMAIIIRRGFILIPTNIIKWWMIFIVYLLIDAILLSERFGYSIAYILFSYNSYYFYLIVFPLVYTLQATMQEKIVLRTIFAVFFPLAALGLAQHFSGDPILPTESVDGYFKVMSWGFFEDVRAFSLFSSGLGYGHYIALVVAFSLPFWWNRKRIYRLFSTIMLCISLIAAYSTMTRLIFLEVLFTLGTIILIKLFCKNIPNKKIIYLPIIYGVIGIIVAYLLEPLLNILDITTTSSIYSSASLMMRYMEWTEYGGEWLGSDILTVLFGTGLIQNDRFDFTQGVVIDNIILATGLHIGIVGLILCFCLMWSIWCEVLQTTKMYTSPISIGIVALFSTWLLTGMFNLTLGLYPLIAMIINVTKGEFKYSCPR